MGIQTGAFRAHLDDIQYVVISCEHCSATVSWALYEPVGTLPETCPRCGVAWFTKGSDVLARCERLIQAMHDAREFFDNPDTSCKWEFQIDEISVPPFNRGVNDIVIAP